MGASCPFLWPHLAPLRRTDWPSRRVQRHPLYGPVYAQGHRLLWLAPLRFHETGRGGGFAHTILAQARGSTVESKPTHPFALCDGVSVQAFLLPFAQTTVASSVPEPTSRWQGFEEILARLDTEGLPVWTPQRREVFNEEVSVCDGERGFFAALRMIANPLRMTIDVIS